MVKTTLVPGVAWIQPDYKADPAVVAPCNEHRNKKYTLHAEWNRLAESLRGRAVPMSDLLMLSNMPRTCIMRRVSNGIATGSVKVGGFVTADNGKRTKTYTLDWRQK